MFSALAISNYITKHCSLPCGILFPLCHYTLIIGIFLCRAEILLYFPISVNLSICIAPRKILWVYLLTFLGDIINCVNFQMNESLSYIFILSLLFMQVHIFYGYFVHFMICAYLIKSYYFLFSIGLKIAALFVLARMAKYIDTQDCMYI